MNRYERKVQFERLLALRDRYQRLTSADTTTLMTIQDALVWADSILTERIATDGLEPQETEESASG